MLRNHRPETGLHVHDTVAEEDETFTVILSNPGGAAQLGTRSVATVTIIDNDVSLLGARATR